MIVKVPIESHFAPPYRIEYDGKYICLFGGDQRYQVTNFYGATEPKEPVYEEMVLNALVAEVRRANPYIQRVTDKAIVINLNRFKDSPRGHFDTV